MRIPAPSSTTAITGKILPFSSNTVNSSAASITPLNTNISFSVCTVTPTAVFTTPVSFSSDTQSKDTVAFLMPLAASDENAELPYIA